MQASAINTLIVCPAYYQCLYAVLRFAVDFSLSQLGGPIFILVSNNISLLFEMTPFCQGEGISFSEKKCKKDFLRPPPHTQDFFCRYPNVSIRCHYLASNAITLSAWVCEVS